MRTAVVLLIVICPTLAAQPPAGEFANESLPVDGTKREYRLVVPATIDRTKPVPLLIAFHGILIDSKDLMPRYSKLNDLAAKPQFIVAYPNAIDRSWGLSPKKVAADLAFFDALVQAIQAKYRIDSNKVFVAGMSNGGYFAHLVGRERAKTVAGVISHSGPLGLETIGGIKASRPFPVMIIHGATDKLIPVSIARENRDKYRKEGHEVEYHEIANHGHQWATSENAAIGEFIQKHKLK